MNVLSVKSPTATNATPAVPAPGNPQTRKIDAFDQSLHQAQRRLDNTQKNIPQQKQHPSAAEDSSNTTTSTHASRGSRDSKRVNSRSNSRDIPSSSDNTHAVDPNNTSANVNQTQLNKTQEHVHEPASTDQANAAQNQTDTQTPPQDATIATDGQEAAQKLGTAASLHDGHGAANNNLLTQSTLTTLSETQTSGASSDTSSQATDATGAQNNGASSVSADLLASSIAGASRDAAASTITDSGKSQGSDALHARPNSGTNSSGDPTLSLLQQATPGINASLAEKLSAGNSTDTTSFASQLSQQMSGSDTQENLGRVARGVQTALNQNGGSVTLRVNPPEMGMVRIQMQIESGVVRADLFTQHSQVSSMLKDDLNQLRQSLESRGLVVDRLQVQTLPSQPVTASQSQSNLQSTPDDGRSRGQFEQQQRDSSGRSPMPNQNGNSSEISDFSKEFLNMVA